MKLKRLRVNKLFGLFDHEVCLNTNERVTIIHAPNGYGKTVLLKFISAMFGGSLATFRDYDFISIEYELIDQSLLTVFSQSSTEQLKAFEGHARQSYRIECKKDGELLQWSPDDIPEDPKDLRFPPSYIERHFPGLRRVGNTTWRTTAGEEMSYSEVMERYWMHLPPSVKRNRRQPDWLVSIRESFNCRLIETQRLMIQKSDEQSSTTKESLAVLAVKTYSDALARTMNRTLAESATLSQSLDRSFPNRILGRMTQPPELNEAAVRYELAELEQKRARLAKVDLLEKADGGSIISHDSFNDEALRILSEYISDTKKKLTVFDDILTRVELFTAIVNEKFSFKQVSISRESGFSFTGYDEEPLLATSLSSGEQHELILLYSLIFDTKTETLLLIDEPEISLHIAWQKKFLPDLRRIIELASIDVILATHSPQLLSGNLDLAVQLKGPSSARSSSK